MWGMLLPSEGRSPYLQASYSPFFLWKALDAQPWADKNLFPGGFPVLGIRDKAGIRVKCVGLSQCPPRCCAPSGCCRIHKSKGFKPCPVAENITSSASFSSSGF